MRRTFEAIAVMTLLSTGLCAQGLEPSLRRAAGRFTHELSNVLLARGDGEVQGLVVVPAWGAPREVGDAVRDALLAVNYRVVTEDEARSLPGILPLKVGIVEGTPHDRIVVETVEETPWRFSCGFGDATWVDDDRDDVILVEGTPRRDREDAIAAVRRAAHRRLLSRAGVEADALGEREVFDRVSHRLFIGELAQDDSTLYRAFLEASASPDVLARLDSDAGSAARRVAALPWIRLAGTLLCAVVLGIGYLRADLSTRGYMTGRLRLLFGTLFVLGAGVCWGIPL